MLWFDHVQNEVQRLSSERAQPINAAYLQKMLGLIDLTRLHSEDSKEDIIALCKKATTPLGQVAAICVYPTFTTLIVEKLKHTQIRTATVVNFPEANLPLSSVLDEIKDTCAKGIQEVDMVFPYHSFLRGDHQYVQDFVAACKEVCGDTVILKVILETGVFHSLSLIADATRIAFLAGADFVKTSTGKIAQGASLEAAATMLLTIRELTPKLNRTLGIKISGGVSDVKNAAQYIQLADHVMGDQWVSPATFRIGASQLLDDVLLHLIY